MAIERTFDLPNFIEFVRAHQASIPELMYFNLLGPLYDATFGGCKCNIEVRKTIADKRFIEVIQAKSNDSFWNEVKRVTLAEKISFKDKLGNIFKEI